MVKVALTAVVPPIVTELPLSPSLSLTPLFTIKYGMCA